MLKANTFYKTKPNSSDHNKFFFQIQNKLIPLQGNA